MDSSILLVQAASGLEKLMAGQTGGVVLKDSTVAQVSAAVFYKASVISKLTTNKEFQNSFNKTIFTQIQKDFGEYVDSQARSKPLSLHHVYEWKRVGDPSARLFKIKKLDSNGLSIRLTYEFLNSKTLVPTNSGKNRYVFKNKASVMEAGMPVIIRPKGSKRLVFEIRGSTVFMPKGASVTVRKPGGGKATSRFQIAFAQFFRGELASLSIKKSGFQQLFNTKVGRALNLPADVKKVKYSFSANTLNMQAASAVSAAFGSTS